MNNPLQEIYNDFAKTYEKNREYKGTEGFKIDQLLVI